MPSNFVTELQTADVLFGRGSGPNDHEGNIRFRQYVAERKVAYLATNHRLTKTKIAQEIVTLVRAENGRFLKKVEPQEIQELGLPEGTNLFEIVDDATIMEKAKQALRQNAAKVREESDQDKSPKHASPQQKYSLDLPPQQETASDGFLPKKVSRDSTAVSLYDFEPRPLQTSSTDYAIPDSRVGVVEHGPHAVSVASSQMLAWDNASVPLISVAAIPQQQHITADYGRLLQQKHNPYLGEPDQPAMFYPPQVHHQPVQPQTLSSSRLHESSNYSMAEIPNEEVSFDNRRGSMTMNDLIKARQNDRASYGSNCIQPQQPQFLQPTSEKSMEDLMDSFSQLRTNVGPYDFQQRRMMASTETMGTIEPLGSVADMPLESIADMSVGTMEGSSYSLFRGNDSLVDMGGPHSVHGNMGNSRSSKTSSESAASLNLSDSINGILSDVRRQVDSEYQPDSLLSTRIVDDNGDSTAIFPPTDDHPTPDQHARDIYYNYGPKYNSGRGM